jgi:hypothetical protein
VRVMDLEILFYWPGWSDIPGRGVRSAGVPLAYGNSGFIGWDCEGRYLELTWFRGLVTTAHLKNDKDFNTLM